MGEGELLVTVATFLIYLIVNRVNGKAYIGQTGKALEHRWRQHVKASRDTKTRIGNNYFHKAIKKHGPDKFDITVIATAKSLEEANALEIHYIALFNSNDPSCGYNCTIGGDGMIPNDVVREKIRQKRLGVVRPQSDAERKWRSEYLKGNTYSLGVKRSDETRKRMSEAAKNSPKAQARIAAMGKLWIGRKHRPESIEKISRKHKERWKIIRAARAAAEGG